MLLPLLCALAIRSQETALSRHITFTAPADSVERVLANLSKATGMTFSVTGPIKKDIIVLRLVDVPLSEAMSKIADVTTAEWQTTGGSYQLVRTPKETAPILAKQHREAVEKLRQLIAESRRFVESAGPLTKEKRYEQLKDEDQPRLLEQQAGTQSYKEARENLESSAESRFALAILGNLDIDQLVRDGENSKNVVYATNATRLQIPLRIDAGQWNRFLSEHNASVRAYSQLYAHRKEGPASFYYSLDRRPIGSSTILEGPVPKVVLTLQESALYDPTIFVQGSIFDSQGELILEMSTNLMSVNAPKEDGVPHNATPPHKDPIEVSPCAQEFAGLVNRYPLDSDKKKPSPRLLQRLLHPNRFEPLAILASEVFLGASKLRNENLAACLEDGMYSYLVDTEAGTPASLQDVLDVCTESSGWLTHGPNDPLGTTADRMDRNALTALLSKAWAAGFVSIDDFAAYASSCDGAAGEVGDLLSVVLRGEFDIPEHGNVADNDWTLLKFYGSLTSGQKADLRTGRNLLFRSFTPQQLGLLASLLLDGRAWSNFQGEDPTIVVPGHERGWSRLATIPTQALVGGFDRNGRLSLKADSEERIISETKDGENSSSEELNLQDFAMRLYEIKHPEFFNQDETPLSILRPHWTTSLTFTFELAPGLSFGASLEGSRADPNTDGYSINNLPADLKSKVAEFFKMFDQQVKDGDLTPPDKSDGGGKPPPPRRFQASTDRNVGAPRYAAKAR